MDWPGTVDWIIGAPLNRATVVGLRPAGLVHGSQEQPGLLSGRLVVVVLEKRHNLSGRSHEESILDHLERH